MTNIRLRIEDTVPTVGFGPSDTPLVAGAGPTGARVRMAPVAYRMAPLTPAPFGTI